ncbi:hypothetical protein [Inhella gelatinilytica]|uniref:Uncharacterized protein n=1 Tax=Inhella gelatinilytica TaxID=2795030 RepID=A0A931IWV4_9BURK|nr:hypothetical protein [Inhella gelatinilytica]MBH9552118.1 hypothetical protein [Inhella gelatinilytica]
MPIQPKALWRALGVVMATAAAWLVGSTLFESPPISNGAGEPHPIKASPIKAQVLDGLQTSVTVASTGSTPASASHPLLGPPPTVWLGRHIGSEGYGPHIAEIAAKGSASEALAAVGRVRKCAFMDELEAFNRSKREGALPEEAALMDQEWAHFQVERSLCQTVTSSHQALAMALARRAAQERVPGGAAALAEVLMDAREMAGWPGVLAQLREAAQRMDDSALELLAFGQRSVSLGDIERMAYRLLYQQLLAEGWRALGNWSSLHIESQGEAYAIELTPQQMSQAKQLADRLYVQCCVNWKKKPG